MSNLLPMKREQFVSMVKRDRPELRHIPDSELPDLIADAMLTPGPGSELIRQYLADHSYTTGLFLGFLNRKRSESEARILENLLAASKAAHEIDMLLEANRLNVPRAVLDEIKTIFATAMVQMTMKTHEINEEIRKQKEIHALSTQTLNQTARLTKELNQADFEIELQRHRDTLERKYEDAKRRIELMQEEFEARKKMRKHGG